MTTPAAVRIHPETGQVLVRGLRRITIAHAGQSKDIDMPG